MNATSHLLQNFAFNGRLLDVELDVEIDPDDEWDIRLRLVTIAGSLDVYPLSSADRVHLYAAVNRFLMGGRLNSSAATG